MTVAFPWSGRDVNALVPLSGRAAVPNTPAGTGFNWPSLVGRVSGYIRPVRGLRGLGQAPDITEVPPGYSGPAYIPPTGPNPTEVTGTFPSIDTSSVASGAPWWGGILSGAVTSGLRVGTQIASYELNPLYQKQTFYQTPQGTIYASNVPSAGIPGVTGATGSMLPILLIGGVVMMFMMSRR